MFPRAGEAGAEGVRRHLLLAAIVVLVAALLAGCTAGPDTAAPQANESATEPNGTATNDAALAENETTEDADTAEPPTLASVGVDANATWNRTLALLDVEADRPPASVRAAASPPGFLTVDTVEYVAAFAGETEAPKAAAWYNPGSETVTIRAETVEERSPAAVEAILAHEYAHAVQFQRGWDSPDDAATIGSEPTARTLYFEGMASYVQAAYGQAYLENGSAWTPANRSAGETVGERFATAPYVEGARYYDDRLESPRELSDVVDDPPATTEQALHGTDEAPRSLSVDPEYDVRNVSATYGRPRGELATREVLRTAVGPDRAAAAAAGWGNDDLLSFHDPSRERRGFVWVHRWDDTTEADEFERAAAELVEQRRGETDEYEFELRRPAPETTVLLAGTNGLADGVSTDADGNESVTVSVSS